jgi:hypothetical protein
VEIRGDDDGDDAGWRLLLTCLPELDGSPISRDIWSEEEKLMKE